MKEGTESFNVAWTQIALRALWNLYNVDHDQVYKRSFWTLNDNPHQVGEIVEFPNYEFNGYYWTIVGNVILIYSINESRRLVRIRACYSAMTGWAQKVFYGEDDPYYEK